VSGVVARTEDHWVEMLEDARHEFGCMSWQHIFQRNANAGRRSDGPDRFARVQDREFAFRKFALWEIERTDVDSNNASAEQRSRIDDVSEHFSGAGVIDTRKWIVSMASPFVRRRLAIWARPAGER
jgi:hypothetical protein